MEAEGRCQDAKQWRLRAPHPHPSVPPRLRWRPTCFILSSHGLSRKGGISEWSPWGPSLGFHFGINAPKLDNPHPIPHFQRGFLRIFLPLLRTGSKSSSVTEVITSSFFLILLFFFISGKRQISPDELLSLHHGPHVWELREDRSSSPAQGPCP